MMTPKMKEDLCRQILNASRQLFLSSKISEVCQEKGTQKQLEFVMELMNEELTLRDENRQKRLIGGRVSTLATKHLKDTVTSTLNICF